MTVQRLKIIGVMASHTLGEGQEDFAVILGQLIARLGCDLRCAPGAGPVTCTLLGRTRSRYHAASPSILSR